MASQDFISAARSLALPIDNESDDDPLPTRHDPLRRDTDQSWSRRSVRSTGDQRPRTVRERWLRAGQGLHKQYMKTWRRLSPVQQAGLIVLALTSFVLSILFLVYSHSIFAWLSPAAKKWRKLPGGWLILWVLTVVVAQPPLIGYSMCVTTAGFVFGMKGWFIVCTATVVGSTCAFIISRTLLRSFVGRLTAKNQQFAALALVLKHDGLKLLTMIRLCGLPYSLSNGAMSTIPTVTWQNFAIATAISTPKLLLHVFVGSRIGDLADNGDKMDTKTRVVSYLSIILGISASAATGYIVYVRTKARAKQLESEETRAAVSGRRTSDAGTTFIDDPAEQAAVDYLRRDPGDGISLHTTYEDDLESGRGRAYRDDFTDDEDALERDVFDVGDGEDDGDDNSFQDRENGTSNKR